MRSTAWATIGSLLAALPAQPQMILSDLRCEPTRRQICLATGCNPSSPKGYTKLSFERSTYARCDAKGCETYSAKLVRDGALVTVEVPGRAMLARIEASASFVEVVTVGLELTISHGSCGIDRPKSER